MDWVIVGIIAFAILVWLGKKAQGKKDQASTETLSPVAVEGDDQELVHFLDAPQYDTPIQLWAGSHEFEFSYLNYDGSRNKRHVTVHSVEQNRFGGLYFTGHCHFKDAERTFKVTKIPTMVKVDGGKKYKLKDLFEEVLGFPMGIHPKVAELRRQRENDLLSRFASCAWEGSMDIEFDEEGGRLTKVMISEFRHPYFWYETKSGSRYKSVRRISSYIRCKDGTIGKRKFIHEYLGIPTRGITWD